MGSRLFDILINIATNTASFESGMQRVESRLSSLGGVVNGALKFAGVTASLAGLTEAFNSAAESGEQMTLMAERMRTSVQLLSQLQYAAKATGVPFEVLSGAIDNLERNLVQAAEGSGRAKVAIADLGIDAGKLSALPLDQQLGIIANRIAALPTPAAQAAAAMRIFGQEGAQLLPILDQGAAGIEALKSRADALGITLGTDTADALAKANSAITDFTASSSALWKEIAGDAAPALTGLIKVVTDVVSGFKNLTFGFSSPQAELDNLNNRAASLYKQINDISAKQGDLSKFNPLRYFGLDEGQLETDMDELNKVLARIQKVKQEVDNTLSPVQVKAQRIGGATDTEQLPEVYFNANGHMVADYYQKIATLGETDEHRVAGEWENKLFYAELSFDRQTQLAEEYYATSDESDAEYVADQLARRQAYLQQVADINAQFLQPIEVSAKRIATVAKSHYDEMDKYARSAADSIQASFANLLEDPSISGFKKMGEAWLQTINKMVADAAASSIFTALFGANTQTGGLEGLFGGLLSSAFGGGSSDTSGIGAAADAGLGAALDSALAGFANGGSFNVGGSGGVDSQLVAFKATPGEHVQVGAGGGGAVTINNYTTVTSPQVTKDDVVGAMQQTQTSTVNQIKDLKRRNKL